MRATHVINLYIGIYKEILAFLIYILFTCRKIQNGHQKPLFIPYIYKNEETRDM